MYMTGLLAYENDQNLVERVKSGDEGAFSELIYMYQSRIFALASRLVVSDQDAEEIVQDVFVSLYRKIGEFEGRSSLSSWLYRITFNCALMKLRTRRRKDRREQMSFLAKSEEGERPDTVEDQFVRVEKLKIAQEVIDSLPESFRTIFFLRDVDGLTGEETALRLGLTTAAVKSRLHRARLMIRKRYEVYERE
jgi:RNA polymerase sigma-70 factor (ECF subfamily)